MARVVRAVVFGSVECGVLHSRQPCLGGVASGGWSGVGGGCVVTYGLGGAKRGYTRGWGGGLMGFGGDRKCMSCN